MHEHSLIANLLQKIETVAHEANATKVTKVKVWLGALAHISPEHFREHFKDGTRGTIADGAMMEIESSSDANDAHAQEILLQNIEVEE